MNELLPSDMITEGATPMQEGSAHSAAPLWDRCIHLEDTDKVAGLEVAGVHLFSL